MISEMLKLCVRRGGAHTSSASAALLAALAIAVSGQYGSLLAVQAAAPEPYMASRA
jgi:hypothetical protein